MIAYFPTILADELLYSAFARYAAATRYPRYRDVHADLFGGVRGHSVIDLPDRLERFAARLPSGHPYTAEQLVEEHTLLPYFRCVLPQDRYARVGAAMRAPVAEAVHPMLLISSQGSSVKRPATLQYCRTCCEEDLAARGGALVWRRVHQLPGVLVCPRHATSLLASPYARHTLRHQHQYHALSVRDLDRGQPISIPPAAPGDLLRLARDAEWLLTAGESVGNRAVLDRALARAVALGGWISPTRRAPQGQLDAPGLVGLLHARWGKPLLTALGCDVSENRRPAEGWLTVLLRNASRPANAHRFGTHPLKVLVAAHALGFSPEKLFAIAEMSDDAFSTAVENASSTRRTRARRGIPEFPTRGPGKRVGHDPIWEKHLRKLVADPANSLGSIARTLGVSKITAKKRAQALGIARPRWTIAAPKSLRRKPRAGGRAWARQSIEECRARVLQLLEETPALKLGVIATRAKRAVATLRQHDVEWAARHLPPRTDRFSGGRRVDWPDRDARLAAEVARVAAEMGQHWAGPRITRSRVLAAVGVHWQFDMPEHYPRVLAEANAAAETQLAFWTRRVAGVAHAATSGGEVLTRTELKRRAKLAYSPTSALAADLTALVDHYSAAVSRTR